MVKRTLTFAVFNTVILLLIVASVVSQELIPFVEGTVTAVTDGDSFVIKSDEGKFFHVRLHGVAAPEKQQPFGMESLKKLSSKILGKRVRVDFKLTDDLARVLGKVVIEDEDVGLEQLRAGLGWYFTHYINELNDDDRLLYPQAADEAKSSRLGLWGDAKPVSPWAYRVANKINEIDQVIPDPPKTERSAILGNSRTKLYLKPNCAGYRAIPVKLRVTFDDEMAAEKAGFKIAKGCR